MVPRRQELYFTDRWIRKFPEDAEAYYGFVPDRRHRAGDDRIKVYYTQDGEVVISNCQDPKLQNKIRVYMENWYGWKRKEHIRKKTFRYPIPVLVRSHTTELNGRFYQIRCGDSVCNIEKSRLDSMTDMVYVHTYPEVIFESDTELETLNKVVFRIAKECYDSQEWPLLTAGVWEKYYFSGSDPNSEPTLWAPIPDMRYDAWEIFTLWGLPDAVDTVDTRDRRNNLFSGFPDLGDD